MSYVDTEFGGNGNLKGNVGINEVGMVQSVQRPLVNRLETEMNHRFTVKRSIKYWIFYFMGHIMILWAVVLLRLSLLTSHRSRKWLRKMKAMFSQPTSCQVLKNKVIYSESGAQVHVSVRGTGMVV